MSSDGHVTPESKKSSRIRSQSFRIERPTFADNVKRTFSRAKARVSHKFGKSDRTRDEFLLQFESNFLKQQEQIMKLQRTFKFYTTNVRAMALAYQQVQDAMMDGYDSSWANRKECGDALQKMMEFWLAYVSVLSNKVRNPLSDYAMLSIDIKSKLAKRNKKLIEYDISRKVLENARSGKKPSDDPKLHKDVEDDFLDAKAAYDDITTELYNELPSYHDKRIQSFIETWELFFVASETLHSELAQQCRTVVESVKDFQLKAFQGLYRLNRPDDEPHAHAFMTMKLDHQNDGRKSSSLSMDDDCSTIPGGYESKFSSVRGSLDTFDDKHSDGVPKPEGHLNGGSRLYKLRSNSLMNVNVERNTSMERLAANPVPRVVDKRNRSTAPSHMKSDMVTPLPLNSMMSAPRVSVSSSTSGGLRPVKVLPNTSSLDKEIAREYPSVLTHNSMDFSTKNKSHEIVRESSRHEQPLSHVGDSRKKAHLAQYRGGLAFHQNKGRDNSIESLCDDPSPQMKAKSNGDMTNKKHPHLNKLVRENGMELGDEIIENQNQNLSHRMSIHEPPHVAISGVPSATSTSVTLPFSSSTSHGRNSDEIHFGISTETRSSSNFLHGHDESELSTRLMDNHRTKRRSSRLGNETMDDLSSSRAMINSQAKESDFITYDGLNMSHPVNDFSNGTTADHASGLRVGDYSNGRTNNSATNLNGNNLLKTNQKVIVRFGYDPQDEDELSLAVGDILQVIPWEDQELKEDGWEFGLHLSTRRKGLFPLNHTAPYAESSSGRQ